MARQHNDKWDGKSRGGSFGHRFFIFLISKPGLGVSYVFLAFVVAYFIPFAPKATSAVWLYNRKILKLDRFRSAAGLFSHYHTFGQTLIDRIAIRGGQKKKFGFDFGNYREFLDILNGGKGAILITAHIGNWETGSAFFGDYGGKMNVVMYDAEYEKIKKALHEQKGSVYKVISVSEENGLESVVRMKKALDEGEYLCFQGDRFLPGAKTVKCDFMGRKASFPAGPFLTASRLRVPVVFYYAMREKGRCYSFHFFPAGDFADGNQLLDKYLRITENMVRSYPRQWFNFYKFWD